MAAIATKTRKRIGSMATRARSNPLPAILIGASVAGLTTALILNRRARKKRAGLTIARRAMRVTRKAVPAMAAAGRALRRNPLPTALTGLAIGGVATALIVRGVRRRVPRSGMRVERAITINRPAEEVYKFWREAENLPEFIPIVESVEPIDDRHARWQVRTPAGSAYWTIALTEDLPGRRLAWRSEPGSEIDLQAEADFRPAPGERGTEVKARLRWAPEGRVSSVIAKMLRTGPSWVLAESLRRLKRKLETGESEVHARAS